MAEAIKGHRILMLRSGVLIVPWCTVLPDRAWTRCVNCSMFSEDKYLHAVQFTIIYLIISHVSRASSSGGLIMSIGSSRSVGNSISAFQIDQMFHSASALATILSPSYAPFQVAGAQSCFPQSQLTRSSCDKKSKSRWYHCLRMACPICLGWLNRIKELRFFVRSSGFCLCNTCSPSS